MELPADCLEFCKTIDGCEWYSFDPSDGLCSAFSACPSLDIDGCAGCVTGEDDCDSYQCFVPGECLGNLIEHADVEGEVECLDTCKATEGCEWFTFLGDPGICLLYETCDVLEQGCQNCVSGENDCSGSGGGEGKSKILSQVELYFLFSSHFSVISTMCIC